MGWNVQIPDAQWFTRETEGLDGLIREIGDLKNVAIDTETTGLNYMKDIVLYWSLSWDSKDKPGFIQRACLRSDVLPFFDPIFKDPTREWDFVNAKFDMHMLYNTGVNLTGKVFDTCVMHALLYDEAPHRLEYMARQLLGWQWKDDFKQGFKTEGPQNFLPRLEREDLTRLVEYASNDAYGTLCCYQKLKKELEAAGTWSLYPEHFATLSDYFYKLEAKFTRVLWKCERRGMHIDMDFLQNIERPVSEDITRLEREVNHIVGRIINLNSRDQLANYFFHEKGYQPKKMTGGGKTGIKKPSVDFDTLEYLYEEYGDPVAEKMLVHRDCTKLHGTVEGIMNGLDQFGRVHTHFNQDVARTGRLSTKDIQFQNLPTVENDKHKTRKSFNAEPDNELIVVDYQALEMRLLASGAMEPDMIQIFLDGKDIHMGNASLVFEVPYDDIVLAKKIDKKVKEGELSESAMTEYVVHCLEARARAKTIGFGLNYGMREGKLARSIKTTKEVAKALLEKYMARYPAVTQFFDDAVNDARQTGYAYTLLGRRRFLPEIVSNNKMERLEAERRAGNTVIQGTAANVAMMAMILIDESSIEDDYGCYMLNQVHDELIFECDKENTKQASLEIVDIMEHPFRQFDAPRNYETEMKVPLKVSLGTGPDWSSAK